MSCSALYLSVWGHGVYTLFGILLLAFILLLIVTAFITVVRYTMLGVLLPHVHSLCVCVLTGAGACNDLA